MNPRSSSFIPESLEIDDDDEGNLSGLAQGQARPEDTLALEPSLAMGRRKTRSQGETEQLPLPRKKRGQSKSRRPPIAEDLGKTQLRNPEGP